MMDHHLKLHNFMTYKRL